MLFPLADPQTAAAIDDVQTTAQRRNDPSAHQLYDLAGRRINAERLPKGIYISGGRKVVR